MKSSKSLKDIIESFKYIHVFDCNDCGTDFFIGTNNEVYSDQLGSCAEMLPSCPECESNNTNMDDVIEPMG